MMIPCLWSLLFGVVLVFLIYFLPAAPDRVPVPHLPHIAAHGNDFAVIIVLFQPRDDNGSIQTAGICQHDLFDLRHRNCLRSNQLIYFSISLVQFQDCSVRYTGTWKMCKKCSAYSSNMKAVFHSGAL